VLLTRRSARRLALIPALLSVCALTLSACGSDDGDDGFPASGKTLDRLDAVTISGDVGTAPEVKWKGEMDAGKVETETVTEGDGDALEDQQSVLAHLWIGNGFSQEQAFSTYDDKKAELLTVNEQLPPFLAGIKDAKVGSRLAITASAEEAFGETGNSGIGIGNKDTVLVIVDLVSKVLDQPEDGERTPPPDWMPAITSAKGVPTGFDFTGTPAPSTDLRRVQLIKGTGPRVEKGQTIAVRYLGEVFGGDNPFDENFSGEGTPTTFGIGSGQVIKGWDKALDGVPVGSRVVLSIPPDLGYGDAGNTDAGIKGTDTLFFVIDVLAAA
jgi:peptidylprolyl isomerase